MNLSGPTVHLKFLKFEMLRYRGISNLDQWAFEMSSGLRKLVLSLILTCLLCRYISARSSLLSATAYDYIPMSRQDAIFNCF